MTDLTERNIEKRIKRLEHRLYEHHANTPDAFEYPDGIGGGGGAANRTLAIPSTNLLDTEEIRQWFVAPAGVETWLMASHLLNDAGQVPAGLTLYVQDFTASVEVYRDGTTYNEPTGISLTAGNTHYVAIENETTAEQNASAVLEMEDTE